MLRAFAELCLLRPRVSLYGPGLFVPQRPRNQRPPARTPLARDSVHSPTASLGFLFFRSFVLFLSFLVHSARSRQVVGFLVCGGLSDLFEGKSVPDSMEIGGLFLTPLLFFWYRLKFCFLCALDSVHFLIFLRISYCLF
jgi:hypothetical protein